MLDRGRGREMSGKIANNAGETTKSYMAFWHEERFGMRKCAVSQKYFYKLARNMATRRRITKGPLGFHLHFYIIEKEIKERNNNYHLSLYIQRQDFYSLNAK